MTTILFLNVKPAGETLKKLNSLWFAQFVAQYIFTKDVYLLDVGNGNAINAQL